MLPCASLPPPAPPVKLGMPLSEGGGGRERGWEVSPTFAYEFFSLVTEKGLLPERGGIVQRARLQSFIQAEGRICCGLSSVHSLVWSSFHSILCSQTEGVALITVALKAHCNAINVWGQ